MAYFPNGTAWACWADDNCFECRHFDDGCPIDLLHNLYNYDQCDDERLRSILSTFIPETSGSVGRCAMFVKSDGEPSAARRVELDRRRYEQALAEMRGAA